MIRRIVNLRKMNIRDSLKLGSSIFLTIPEARIPGKRRKSRGIFIMREIWQFFAMLCIPCQCKFFTTGNENCKKIGHCSKWFMPGIWQLFDMFLTFSISSVIILNVLTYLEREWWAADTYGWIDRHLKSREEYFKN